MSVTSCALARQRLVSFVEGLRERGVVTKGTTAVKAGYVGSIVTPMRAVVGNASWGGLKHLAIQPTEAAVDYMVALARSAATGFKVQPHEFREVALMLDRAGVGVMVRGFKKGAGPMREAWSAREGDSIGARVASFIEEARLRLDADGAANVIEHERVTYKHRTTQALVDGAFMVLEALDRPWWKMAFDGSLHMQATVHAIRSGAKGAARKQLIAELFETPTDEMLARATDDANQATFKDRNLMSRTATHLKRGINREAETAPTAPKKTTEYALQRSRQIGAKGGQVAVELNVPFTGVPSSVAYKVLATSPLGFFSPNLLFGSAPQRIRALAQAGVGSALWALGYQLAQDGLVSGLPPETPSDWAQWDAEGRQALSVKIGNTWVGVNSLGPAAIPLIMGAQLRQYRADNPDAALGEQAGAMAATMGRVFSEQAYMTGIRRALEAMDDPESKGTALAVSQIPIPAASGQVARALDPYVRENHTIRQRLTNRIPILSQTNPAKLDPTGQPVRRTPMERVGAAVSPFPLRESKDTPLLAEMRRLGVTFGMPSRTEQIDGRRYPITPDAYRQMVQQMGPEVVAAIEDLLEDPEYLELTDEERAAELKAVIAAVKRDERAAFLESQPLPTGARP